MVWAKVQELESDTAIKCITEHPGFRTVCLDIWVLQTAYFHYRQEHGHMADANVHRFFYYST